jgi:hypothetical protein
VFHQEQKNITVATRQQRSPLAGTAGNDLLLIGNGGKGPANARHSVSWSFARLLDWDFATDVLR